MYDIHCHILPGLDDGAEDLEEALEMARLAEEDGTTVIAATPHADDVTQRGGPVWLKQQVAAFNHELEVYSLALRVVGGAEYRVLPSLAEEAKKDGLITLNGSRYLLVELDFFQYSIFADEVLFQLQLHGLDPIIAHPERQATFQQHPDKLAALVERGVLTEITGGSLTGAFGPLARKSAEKFLKMGLVHMIASDAHQSQGPRRPGLSQAIHAAARLVGQKLAQTLVVDNPRAVVMNGEVERPVPKVRSSFFHRLFRS